MTITVSFPFKVFSGLIPFSFHITNVIVAAILYHQQAWYMDDVPGDQREPHKTDRSVSSEELDALGVVKWSGLQGAEDPELDKVRSYGSLQTIFFFLRVFILFMRDRNCYSYRGLFAKVPSFSSSYFMII